MLSSERAKQRIAFARRRHLRIIFTLLTAQKWMRQQPWPKQAFGGILLEQTAKKRLVRSRECGRRRRIRMRCVLAVLIVDAYPGAGACVRIRAPTACVASRSAGGGCGWKDKGLLEDAFDERRQGLGGEGRGADAEFEEDDAQRPEIRAGPVALLEHDLGRHVERASLDRLHHQRRRGNPRAEKRERRRCGRSGRWTGRRRR